MEEENEDEIKEYKKQNLNNMIEMFRYHDRLEKVKAENSLLSRKIEDLATRVIDETEVKNK